MSRETTYAGMVGDWQKLLVTLEANIAEIPQLEPFRAKLAGMVTQGVGRHQAAGGPQGEQAGRVEADAAARL